MNLQMTGDWVKGGNALRKLLSASDKALKQSLVKAARLQKKLWISGITGGKMNLKELSIVTKSSTNTKGKALYSTGAMVRSIKEEQITPYLYFVGISNQEKRDSGGKKVDMAKIAAAHEFGGVIRPKKSGALALPITREAQAAGSPTNFPRELRFVKASGKNKNVVGVLITADRNTEEVTYKAADGKYRKKNRNTKVAYLLLRKAVLPARPHRSTAHEEFIRVSAEFIGDALGTTLKSEME